MRNQLYDMVSMIYLNPASQWSNSSLAHNTGFLLLVPVYSVPKHIDGLVQDYSKSIANALDLLQPCIKPSIWPYTPNCCNARKYTLCWICCWHVIKESLMTGARHIGYGPLPFMEGCASLQWNMFIYLNYFMRYSVSLIWLACTVAVQSEYALMACKALWRLCHYNPLIMPLLIPMHNVTGKIR